MIPKEVHEFNETRVQEDTRKNAQERDDIANDIEKLQPNDKIFCFSTHSIEMATFFNYYAREFVESAEIV